MTSKLKAQTIGNADDLQFTRDIAGAVSMRSADVAQGVVQQLVFNAGSHTDSMNMATQAVIAALAGAMFDMRVKHETGQISAEEVAFAQKEVFGEFTEMLSAVEADFGKLDLLAPLPTETDMSSLVGVILHEVSRIDAGRKERLAQEKGDVA